MRKETPAPWLKLMEAQDIPSLRSLAEIAGVAHTVTSRMVHGTGKPKDESINAVAKALRVPPATIYDLVGQSVPAESGPWKPPAEAARLTTGQREALTQLIRTMVDPEQGTAPVKQPEEYYQEAYDRAANKGRSRGRALHDAALAHGEESQDTPGDH